MTRVYSRREVRALQIRARRPVGSIVNGEAKTRMRSVQGQEFSDFRQYEPGDDIGRIDWNVTARLGQPWVRLYQEERGHPVMLIVDVSSSTAYGRSNEPAKDVIAHVAARLASAAIWDGCRTGLLLAADKVRKHVRAGTGLQHLSYMIRQLAQPAGDDAATNLGRALEYVQALPQRRCLIFLLSDFLCDDFATPLLRCARRHEIVAIGVEDPEAALPDCGLINLRDPETGLLREIDTASSDVRSAFSEMVSGRRASHAESFRKAGVDYLGIHGNTNYMDTVSAFLRQRVR